MGHPPVGYAKGLHWNGHTTEDVRVLSLLQLKKDRYSVYREDASGAYKHEELEPFVERPRRRPEPP